MRGPNLGTRSQCPVIQVTQRRSEVPPDNPVVSPGAYDTRVAPSQAEGDSGLRLASGQAGGGIRPTVSRSQQYGKG